MPSGPCRAPLPDFNDKFEIGDDLHGNVALPPQPEFEAQAAQGNPTSGPRWRPRKPRFTKSTPPCGISPTVTLDYFYGIDAPQYAVNGSTPPPNSTKYSNLGYSAVAALNLPIWNWGATQSRVRAAELQRDQAKRELSFARANCSRKSLLYSEAETALTNSPACKRSRSSPRSLRLTTMRYQGGEATVLEVVDAQSTFAQASAAYQDGAVAIVWRWQIYKH